jgi:nucleotide-binding universal stress UspA family protein
MVAVDGFEHSMKAVELAIQVAKATSAQVSLIHVFEKDKVPDWFKDFAEVEQLGTADYFDIVDQRLFAPIIARVKESKVQFSHCIRATGDPADEILKNAEDGKVDLIVMGTRGLGTLSSVILGSISSKVLSKAKCSCIAVK